MFNHTAITQAVVTAACTLAIALLAIVLGLTATRALPTHPDGPSLFDTHHGEKGMLMCIPNPVVSSRRHATTPTHSRFLQLAACTPPHAHCFANSQCCSGRCVTNPTETGLECT
jgi:hypothetical protein